MSTMRSTFASDSTFARSKGQRSIKKYSLVLVVPTDTRFPYAACELEWTTAEMKPTCRPGIFLQPRSFCYSTIMSPVEIGKSGRVVF